MLEIILKRPIMLGLGSNVPTLKAGEHRIEDHYQKEWWFEALVASGDIVVKAPPVRPSADKIATVNIPAQGPVIVSIVEETSDSETAETKNEGQTSAEGVKTLSRTSEEATDASEEERKPEAAELEKKGKRFSKARK